jgi:hypothetical protein
MRHVVHERKRVALSKRVEHTRVKWPSRLLQPTVGECRIRKWCRGLIKGITRHYGGTCVSQLYSKVSYWEHENNGGWERISNGDET